jgi:hypothetical protein
MHRRALLTISTFALAALSAFAALPASADFYANEKTSTDPNRPAVEALVKEFASIPAAFGCDEFAWGKMGGPSDVTMEFVPAGDDVRKWTKLVTIQTIALPADEAAQVAEMKKLVAIGDTHFRQNARVSESVERGKGTPARFMEYEIGKGAATEHNAVGILRLRSGLAGIVQVQSRGKPLAREDAAKMKALAIGDAHPTPAAN